MAKKITEQSEQMLWRTISTTLMDAEPRAALVLSAESDEGAPEAALGACRAARAEGLSACLVSWSAEPEALLCDAWRPSAEDDDDRLPLPGHTLSIRHGAPGEPDVLDFTLKEGLLRDLVTNARAKEGANAHVIDALLSGLGLRYDVTIVIGGAALVDPYALILADSVPGVVLVVRSGRTRLADAGRAKSLIESAGGSILGVVMTHRQTYLPAWLDRRL